MSLGRRGFLGGVGTMLGIAAAPRVSARPSSVRHVREFGARGDGVTNDTDALAAAARFIETQGGGTLVFEPRTYLIGRQAFDGTSRGWAYDPADVIAIRRCPEKVTLIGNGAVLRSAPGLRFGSFDPLTGRPASPKLPFYDPSYFSSPYKAAILLEENSGGIEISGFELDGRINEVIIGGRWGDSGWQVPHHGILLYDNRGQHRVADVYSHHHGCDGMVYFAFIKSEASPAIPTSIDNCRFEYNGRQGLSIVGGRSILVSNSRFNSAGQNGVIDSNPHAGVDVEAEGGSLIRDVTFVNCEFAGNAGAGFLADSGNSAGIRLRRCRFIGSDSWAMWPNKPNIRVEDSLIVGAAIGFYSEKSGGGAAPQIRRCRFTDDPKLSPTGEIYGTHVELGDSVGVLFDDCDFDYRSMRLPAAQRYTRFHNCRMSSPAPGTAQLNGIFTGVNVIQGGADLSDSQFLGQVIHNGRLLGV